MQSLQATIFPFSCSTKSNPRQYLQTQKANSFNKTFFDFSSFSEKSTVLLHPKFSLSTSYIKESERSSSISSSIRETAINEIQSATDLASKLSRFGGDLQAQDLNILLRHFGKLERWKDVTQLFDYMQKNTKLNIGSYSSYMKLMGKASYPMKALKVYESIYDESVKMNISVFNSLIGSLVKNGKFMTALEIFDRMKNGGLIPDVITYSTLLHGCIKMKNGYSKAMLLVKEFENYGLKMDYVIYGNLLAICASNNLCDEAEGFFQKMKDEGLHPNEYHYSSLLNAYSTIGNHHKAEKLVEDMKSSRLVPNKVIVTTLLKVYAKGGFFEKSQELLHELEGLGHAQDEMPYCILMDGFTKAGHINEAKVIFEDMKKKNVKSDGYAYSIMISAFCRAGLLEDARKLATDYESSYNKYDLVMMNTLLRAYCRAGDMQRVMQLLNKMDELSIAPDGSTFHILIKYFTKEKMYQLAFKLVVDMHSKGHQLDEELCSSLIFHLGQVGSFSEVLSVYNMLRYSKRTLCKDLHEKVLNILVTGGLLKDAYVVMKDHVELISPPILDNFARKFMIKGNANMIIDVLRVMHSSGCKIDKEVFDVAVSRYIEHGKKEILFKLLNWMTTQGYSLSSSSRNLLIKNSNLFGRHAIAELLSKQYTVSRKSEKSKG